MTQIKCFFCLTIVVQFEGDITFDRPRTSCASSTSCNWDGFRSVMTAGSQKHTTILSYWINMFFYLFFHLRLYKSLIPVRKPLLFVDCLAIFPPPALQEILSPTTSIQENIEGTSIKCYQNITPPSGSYRKTNVPIYSWKQKYSTPITFSH